MEGRKRGRTTKKRARNKGRNGTRETRKKCFREKLSAQVLYAPLDDVIAAVMRRRLLGTKRRETRPFHRIISSANDVMYSTACRARIENGVVGVASRIHE